jgi:hypothetical protein
MSKHARLTTESTLTTPCDRNTENKFKLDGNIPVLNENESEVAIKSLNNKSYISNFPQVERRYADPVISDQKICLISFVPAKGATPNENGIYGFAKVRGSYPNDAEANQRAEYLIKNIDSYHKIYHSHVGRPFPLTNSSDFSQEIIKINLKQDLTDSMSADMKNKRNQEQKEMEEIRDREKELLEDTKREEPTDDHYTTLRVKKAQLTWTYIETEKKLQQMAGLIAKAMHETEQLDRNYPELKEKYYNKYMEARKTAGLPTDAKTMDQSFMKYLVEDVYVKAVNEEYMRLYSSED